MEYIFALPAMVNELEKQGFEVISRFRPEGWAGGRSAIEALVMAKEETLEEDLDEA